MFKLAWDALLSLCFRGVFTFTLAGGACFLAWTYSAWRSDYWDGSPNEPRLCFVLAGICILVGVVGAFRRGGAEQDFSMTELAFGSVAGTGPRRTLRRFPTFESLVLGGMLIAMWIAGEVAGGKQLWAFRTAAGVGLVQIAWGLTFGRVRRGPVKRTSG